MITIETALDHYIVSCRKDAIFIIEGFLSNAIEFTADWGDQLTPIEEQWAKEYDACHTC